MEQEYKAEIMINSRIMDIARIVAEQSEQTLSEWINAALERQIHIAQKEHIYQMYLNGDI